MKNTKKNSNNKIDYRKVDFNQLIKNKSQASKDTLLGMILTDMGITISKDGKTLQTSSDEVIVRLKTIAANARKRLAWDCAQNDAKEEGMVIIEAFDIPKDTLLSKALREILV